jgi:hypothetical protein
LQPGNVLTFQIEDRNNNYAQLQYTVPYGQWLHVAGTLDGATGQMKLYVNANLVASTTTAVRPLGALDPAYSPGIGIGHDKTGQYGEVFNGWLDEVRLSDVALDPSQFLLNQTASCPPATATAEVVNGFVVGATITFAGCDYTNTPLVLFQGGGGTGAAATAVVSNGVVEQIIITDAGIGYTNPPAILIGSAPSIAVQPESITVNYGGNVSFNVTLANPTPVAYQWLFDSNIIPGATFSTLTISNVAQTNLGAYSVVLTSPFGTTNSSDAILSMYPFLAGPFGGAVTYWGMPATLSVQAMGSDPLSYQWYQNGVAVPNGTNAMLSFDAIQFTNSGLYSVVVTSPYGSVTNTPAQVVVNPAGISFGLYPGLTISGVVGYNYIIRRTVDLSDTNAWVTMTNLTLAEPVELWVDTSVDASLPANPHHFYQVLPGQ